MFGSLDTLAGFILAGTIEIGYEDDTVLRVDTEMER